MPDLYGQQGGNWLPAFRPGNWNQSWGLRPEGFTQADNPYSYFSRNPGQVQNYVRPYASGLTKSFQNWGWGNLFNTPTPGTGGQYGPGSNPNGGGKTLPTPNQPSGQVPGNQDPYGGGGTAGVEDPYGTNEAYANQYTNRTVKPGMLGNYGSPLTQQSNVLQPGVPQYPLNKFPQNNIGDFRGRGWF